MGRDSEFPCGKKAGRGFLAECLSVFAIVSCLSTCQTRKGQDAEPVPVHRYEVALMQMDTACMPAELGRLALAFPFFFEGADLTDSLNVKQIKLFMEDPVARRLYAYVVSQYGTDSLRISQGLGVLFSKAKRMDPGFREPEVYTYLAYPYFQDYASRIIYQDSVMVLGLDFYVDGNQPLLDEFGIPRYMSRRMKPDYLLPDVARILSIASVGGRECESLLDHIVQEGKVMYMMRRLLPDTPLPVLLAYTDEQLSWCEANEAFAWAYLIQQDLLFATDPFEYRYFVNDGPFNPALPGAPARLAQFIGWKMVEAYMENSSSDLEDLRRADARTVLEVSRYKP